MHPEHWTLGAGQRAARASAGSSRLDLRYLFYPLGVFTACTVVVALVATPASRRVIAMIFAVAWLYVTARR